MGRKRQYDKHLVNRLRRKRQRRPDGSYYYGRMWYYREKSGRDIPLSRDFDEAYAKYLRLTRIPDVVYKLTDLMNLYLVEETPKKSKSTQMQHQWAAKNISNVFYEFGVDDVETHHVCKYLDKRGKEAPQQANKERAFFSLCFQMGIRKGICRYNPVKDSPRFKHSPRKRDVQLWEFEEVKNHCSPMGQLILMFALLTGQRRKDILNIKWIDLKDDGIHMKDYKKNEEPYLIPWSDGLRTLISQLRDRKILGLYLFVTTKYQPYTPSGFHSLFQVAIDKAINAGKLKEPFQFRDLRALTAKLIRKSRGKLAATDTLGHTDSKITEKVYFRDIKERKPLN